MFRAIIFCVLLLVGCASKSAYPFDRADIISAQKLYGVEFSDAKIDTMMGYLARNRASYDTTQSFNIQYNEWPAIVFDPLPDGFELPEDDESFLITDTTGISTLLDRERIPFLSVLELGQLLETRQISSLELTELYIDRLSHYDHQLKAVITLIRGEALHKAKQMDKEINAGKYRGPLHGIPYGLKDIIAVKGHKTTWGSEPYKNQVINDTAELVEKLDDAGAILVAKLTSGALARGDVWYGGKTRNPWDLEQGSSGSSAGSASATAAGLIPFAIGSETWGSILSPSSRCGVTGLRPTYGRVSRHGVMALSWSMDKVGPICRNAQDCAIIMSVINGSDGRDRSVYNMPFGVDLTTDISTIRVGVIQSIVEKDTSDSGSNGRAALVTLNEMGVKIDSITLPKAYPFRLFDTILRAESGAFFDDLVRSGHVDLMVQQTKNSRANSLRQSRFIPAVEYLQANRLRKRLINDMFELFQTVDVIIAPGKGSQQSLITNLTGHPAISIPSGFDEKGRPTSITLIGDLFEEASIIRLAHAFQQRTDHETQIPPLFRH